MRKKQIRTIIIVAAVIVVLAGVTVLAVNNYGSSADPLVSMSYINDKLTPTLQNKFAAQLDSKATELETSFASAVSGKNGGFASVSMTDGQKLTCAAGSEILLVNGTASAATKNAVTDVTDGTSLDAGTVLAANHLYMTAADGVAVTAKGNAAVMVRGTATVS